MARMRLRVGSHAIYFQECFMTLEVIFMAMPPNSVALHQHWLARRNLLYIFSSGKGPYASFIIGFVSSVHSRMHLDNDDDEMMFCGSFLSLFCHATLIVDSSSHSIQFRDVSAGDL